MGTGVRRGLQPASFREQHHTKPAPVSQTFLVFRGFHGSYLSSWRFRQCAALDLAMLPVSLYALLRSNLLPICFRIGFNLNFRATVCSVWFGRLLFSVHQRSLTVTTNSMEYDYVRLVARAQFRSGLYQSFLVFLHVVLNTQQNIAKLVWMFSIS